MSKTACFTHPVCIAHNPGYSHPECPERLQVIMDTLIQDRFSDLSWQEAPKAERSQLERVHSPKYICKLLNSSPSEGRVFLDPDTAICPSSMDAALRAAGGVCAAIDMVVSKEINNAFCAVRPPGHHAEYDCAMGFCLLNSVAIGAEHARTNYNMVRIAILDFDVHHGNGTQNFCYTKENLFFASSHQFPAYPGSGKTSETGINNTNVNILLKPGSGSAEFRDAWARSILPSVESFNPQLIIISAGFDAHEHDPLANLNVQTSDFQWLTTQILGVAHRCCEGRLVSSLEGGYDLGALSASVANHVEALMTYK